MMIREKLAGRGRLLTRRKTSGGAQASILLALVGGPIRQGGYRVEQPSDRVYERIQSIAGSGWAQAIRRGNRVDYVAFGGATHF